MRDFDASRKERARLKAKETFKLGGEEFTVRTTVRPEVIVQAEDLDAAASSRDTLVSLDDMILAFIDPRARAHDRYRKVRESEKDPVTLEDIAEVIRWLVEVYTARPTQPPTPSSPGRRRTGTRSTARSRSAAAPR